MLQTQRLWTFPSTIENSLHQSAPMARTELNRMSTGQLMQMATGKIMHFLEADTFNQSLGPKTQYIQAKIPKEVIF